MIRVTTSLCLPSRQIQGNAKTSNYCLRERRNYGTAAVAQAKTQSGSIFQEEDAHFTPEQLEMIYKYLVDQRKRKQLIEQQPTFGLLSQQQKAVNQHLSSTANTKKLGFVPLESGARLTSFEELLSKVAQTKLRRAWYTVPASKPHEMENTATLGLDVVCFDLEAGVAADQKQQARKNIIEALQNIDFGRTEVFVRINKVGSGYEVEDLKTVFSAVRPHGLLIPKVESAKEVQNIHKVLEELENRHHVQSIINGRNKTSDSNPRKQGIQTFSLMCGIETAKGICNLNEIAQSDIRLEGLIFGAEDYTASIGAKRTRQGTETSYARSAVLNHAAAYELQAIDMMTSDTNIEEDARDSADMGFVGKQAMYSSQIELIHNAFTPSHEDVVEAAQIFHGFIYHHILGQSGQSFKGPRTIDMPVALQAARILQRANQIRIITNNEIRHISQPLQHQHKARG